MRRPVSKRIRYVLRLSATLAASRFKSQNEGSYLGVLWYLLDPLLLFGVILIVRGAAFPAKPIELFPVYLLIGLLMLHMFSKTTTASITAISRYRSFIQNMSVPREAFVIAEVLQRVLMHPFEIAVLILVILFVGGTLSGLLLYPLIAVSYIIFLVGATLILAPIGAYVRDFANLWTPFTRVLLFTTPIFYHATPDMLTYKINLFNPVFHYAQATRAALLPTIAIDPRIIVGLVLFPLISCAIGFPLFFVAKRRFAELTS